MKIAFDERESITDDLVCKLSGEGGLYEEGALGLENLLVCSDGVDEESLAVGKVQVSDKGRTWMVSGPLAEELRKPRDLKELCGLAEEEGIVGWSREMSQR